jgi:hypothetical protein
MLKKLSPFQQNPEEHACNLDAPIKLQKPS